MASLTKFSYKWCVQISAPLVLHSLVSILVTALLGTGYACAAPHPEWIRVADDLDPATVDISGAGFFSSTAILLRTSLERYQVRVIRAAEFGWPRSDVRSLARASGSLITMNANFFDEQGHALGLIVSRGTLIQPLHKGGNTLTGVFQITPKGPQIVGRNQFALRGLLEAVQAGPRLIRDRAPTSTSEQSEPLSRRAGVCVDGKHRLILFCVGSGLSGVGFRELQTLLQSVDCVDALNFDGGGSAQLYIHSKLPGSAKNQDEVFVRGHDDVPVVIGLNARDP